MDIGPLHIDLNALAALITALTTTYAVVRGNAMRKDAKGKDVPDEGKNQIPG